jgi:drug/metabolite transporter (DMT)-like permease
MMRVKSPSTTGTTVLLVASVSFGSSAIFIRFAPEASAISLTFFRLLIAAAGMVSLAFYKHDLVALKKRDLLLVVVSGGALSLHFATFILAVKVTTVANATFLVNTSPIMLAVMSPLLIKERTTSREWLAVVVAMSGILLVANAGNGFRTFGPGDFAALASAFLVAAYSLIGRHMRTRGVNTATYTAYVYGAATVFSLALVGAAPSQTFIAYDAQNLWAIIGLGIVPTMLGHSLYNYSLGSVKAVTANIFPLLEPIIASLFAVVLFGEIPTVIQSAGYSLILVGVVIVATSRSLSTVAIN